MVYIKALTTKEIEMTAEQIEEIICSEGYNNPHEEHSHTPDYTEEERIELIKEYARQKCKEQREICAEQDDYYGPDADGTSRIYEHLIEEQILTSPEPKFD